MMVDGHNGLDIETIALDCYDDGRLGDAFETASRTLPFLPLRVLLLPASQTFFL